MRGREAGTLEAMPERSNPLAATVVAAVCLAAGMASAQTVYRYKDEAGRWVYSDRPPASLQPVETVAIPVGTTSPRIEVQARSAPEGVELVAVNDCACPVEFGILATGAAGEQSARGVVGPRSQQTLLAVGVPAGGQVRFDYHYVIGDPTASHAPLQPYRAPFAPAASYTVTQAPPDAYTHRDAASRHAIDIAMPVGSAVHAAREGTVINVAHRYFRGGTQQALIDDANFVQVLHDDGTSAVYAHLQLDSVRVRPGQRVERGEYIASSGNTGYSSGPHLHFVVLRNAGLRSESVPVAFAGPGGARVTARSGQALVAY
jgi:hypothetical protein